MLYASEPYYVNLMHNIYYVLTPKPGACCEILSYTGSTRNKLAILPSYLN